MVYTLPIAVEFVRPGTCRSNNSTRGSPQGRRNKSNPFPESYALSIEPHVPGFVFRWLQILPLGNPLSIIGYCSLMMERNLGCTVLATTIGSTTTNSLGHIGMVESTGSTEGLEADAEGMAPAPESEGGRDGDEEAERSTVDRPKSAPSTTVFRCPGRRHLPE